MVFSGCQTKNSNRIAFGKAGSSAWVGGSGGGENLRDFELMLGELRRRASGLMGY
jgi:hypothetical protein